MFPKYLPVSMSGGTLMHGVKADPRWQGDGWEHMKGQGTIILNLDGIELHQVNGRPTAIGFFTLTVPYTVELDWDKQPDEADLMGVLGSVWHPQNLESKLAGKKEKEKVSKKPAAEVKPYEVQPKYQNAFDLRMMVQLQIAPPPPGTIEWHIGAPRPGKPAPPPRKGDCGPWYVEKQGNEEVVVNACGGVLTGTFTTGGTASLAANALNEDDGEAFESAIDDISYHSNCEDITGEDCPMVIPGFGDNDWVGIGEYGSDGTDGYVVYENIPPGSSTRNLKIKVGAFEPRFPMYREWSSMLTRKRGQ